MPRTFLALRSVLYVPGSNERALEKSRTLPADAFIFDLEDAVAPSAKEQARSRVCAAVGAGGFGRRQAVIRVNGLNSHWGFDDLAAAAKSPADAILLPKVESGDMVRQAEAIMAENGAADTMAIWCMVETPRGILHAEEVAAASRRIRCLVMGTSDLAKNLGATHTRERLPFVTSLGVCLLAARACDVAIVDGVHLDLEDEDGFAHACRQGAEFGFDGKTLIHPKTISVANAAFSPSAQELAWSRRIIEASKEARERGEGLVVVDGKLIENLHVEGARRSLLLARAIADLEKDLAR
ncbi:MAG TPA: CoA ester lyase [Alphaproteobacteria bacterium]|nr:CoA ester lyase [Alphaproteobacteria bacterium]